MAKKTYIGVNNVARQVKKVYIGVNGVARKVKKIYIGVANIARQIFGGGELSYRYHYKVHNLLRNRYTSLFASSLKLFKIFVIVLN